MSRNRNCDNCSHLEKHSDGSYYCGLDCEELGRGERIKNYKCMQHSYRDEPTLADHMPWW